MPRKKPARVLEEGDDGYSMEMRARLKNLKLKEEKDAGEARSVSETKVDDLISKEVEDAKINGLYAMWYMDKEADRAKQERVAPSKEVLRKRFKTALRKLDGPEEEDVTHEETAGSQKGFLELAAVQDIDELFARAASTPSVQATEAAPRHEDDVRSDDRDGIVEYLETLQKRSAAQDAVSRRVVKSPDERRQDYEATKVRMLAVTAALGFVGTGAANALYSVNEAFSFGLGAVGAVLYLSGLSNYADNAETPMGNALGGRRLLVPVIVVLLVTQWAKIEAQVPAVEALHLEPSLLPAILGFFLYSVGKVLGTALGGK